MLFLKILKFLELDNDIEASGHVKQGIHFASSVA